MTEEPPAHPALLPPAEGQAWIGITPEQLRDWPRGEAPQVVDVREAWELALCSLPGATHIPLGELPGQAAALERDRPTVLVCHHGVRSAAAARFLAGLDFSRVFNLDGGIDAWAASVDTEMRRY